MQQKQKTSNATFSPLLSLVAVVVLLAITLPTLGSIASADTTTQTPFENPTENYAQLNTSLEKAQLSQQSLRSSPQYYDHSVTSQINIGGSDSQVFRVISSEINATRVVQNKSIRLTILVDNTGVETKEEFLDLEVAPQDTSTVSPETNFVSVDPGEQKKYSYTVSFSDTGTYTMQVSNTNVVRQVEVVDRSSTVYDGNIKSSVERQSVSKVITSYKDERSETNQPAFNSRIPPVVETSNGSFENSAIGRIFDFGNAQSNDNSASLTLQGNDTAEQLSVGTAFENVPAQNHYTIQLNYQIDPDTSATEEDQNIEVQVVTQDGTVIDQETKYILDANTSTTGRETRYFSLSNDEIDYVQNNKNIYLVFTSDSNPEADIYYKRAISSNTILETTSGQTEVTDVETHDVDSVGGLEEDTFGVYEPIHIQVTKQNFGSSVAERDVQLEEDGEVIGSKKVRLNPGEEKKVSFIRYRPTGYYTYSSEGYGATQVTVGTPSGDSNQAPNARIETDIERINNVYVPTGSTPADDTVSTFQLDGSLSSDPNGDTLSYSWRIDGTEVATSETLSSSQFPSEGTKEVELVVSDGEEEDVARMDIALNDIEPTAQFTARPTSAPLNTPVQFDGSDAQDGDGNIVSYEWRVDGTTLQESTSPFFDYTFNSIGTESVTLQTTDDDGNTNSRTQTIDVYEADITPTFTTDPSDPRTDAQVSFDASASTTTDGTIEEYRWYKQSNGEQLGSGQFLQHTFQNQGPQTVELEVETSTGAIATTSKTFDVRPPFEADASAGDYQKQIGETFYVNSYNSDDPQNTIESYEWTMGDGTTYEAREIFHEYTDPGTYDVTLTVYGDGYSDSDTIQLTVTSANPEAVAQFGSTIYLSETIQFYGDESQQDDGYLTGYFWDFGDGTTTDEVNPDHQYTTPTNNTDTEETLRDPYTSELTVTGQYGSTDTDSVQVEVLNRGPYRDYTVGISGDERNEDTSSDYEGWISSEFTFDGSPSYHFEEPIGDITTHRWEITRPDGTEYTRTRETITEDFNQIGEYQIKYAIRDQWDYWNNTTFTFDVDARPPQASYTYAPQEPGPSEPVDYDGSTSAHNEPDGVIQSYDWNFGDGTGNNTGETTSHIFSGSSSQTYTATLTVTDQWGQTDSVTKTITTDPYQSCHDLLVNRQDAETGTYPIDPDDDGDGTIEVTCNMDDDGGGWTVIDKQTMWDISTDTNRQFTTNGDVSGQRGSGWDVSRNDVWSVDDGGDHSFVYSIDTGFQYQELRVVDYKLGATSYRVNGATSEMRGDNTALEDWDGLNSGGVSGDGGFGTANSVLDSYNNAFANNCPSGSGTSSWPSCGQYTGDSGINTAPSGTPYFWDNGDTYQVEASSLAVGWGESGGQEEGWEWEDGSFWVRQPIGTFIYFYDNGNNIRNYQQQSVNSGSVNFQSSQVELHSNNGNTIIRNSDNIDLSRYNTIYIDYILTNRDNGNGYVELDVNGRTARDEINGDYLVNDGSLEIDVSDMTDTSANIDVIANADGSDTTVEVQRVWGREGGSAGSTTVYNQQFNGDTGDWGTSSSNNLETTNGWLRLQCDTGINTGEVSKTFSPSIDADSVNYEVSFAASDSWDGETLELQFRDDSGWNTVRSTTPDYNDDGASGDTVYDCQDTNYPDSEYTWSGSYNVDGQITDVRFSLGKNQDDDDEGLAIDYITIER